MVIGDLSLNDGLLAPACTPEKAILFPAAFAHLAQNVLLLLPMA